MNHKIQIVGNFLEKIENPLYRKDIHIDSIIGGVNPIAFCDEPDDSLCYVPAETDKVNILLNIRKNFRQMLSRDRSEFESNVIRVVGRVRDKNYSDYILVCNNLFYYQMIKKDGYLYTNVQCDFCEELIREHIERISFPYPEDFDWKTNYYKFIDIIKSEYPADHIILLKSSVGPYIVENGLEVQRHTKWEEYAVFLREADEIFAERTGCICIDEYEASVVASKVNVATPFSVRSEKILDQLSNTIYTISEKQGFYNAADDILNNKELRSRYYPHIIGDLRKEYIDILRNKTHEAYEQVSCNIAELNDFFARYSCYSITELYTYIVARDTVLLSVIEKYLHYFECDINDILTIYNLYTDNYELHDFSDIAHNIIHNSDSTPVRKAFELYRKNAQRLSDYEYIHGDLLSGVEERECVYFALNNELFLTIDLNAERMFELRKIVTSQKIAFSECKENDFKVPISCANGILSDFRFYIERAKNGCGAVPIRISFESIEQFEESLWAVDWSDVLANEPFVLVHRSANLIVNDYKPVCDLSFLYSGNTRIFAVRFGLADQMCYYLWSKFVEEHSQESFHSYYDDVSIQTTKTGNMMPLYLSKVISEDISDKLLTKKLSDKLRIESANTSIHFCDTLIKNGCKDIKGLVADPIRANHIIDPYKYKEKLYRNNLNPDFIKFSKHDYKIISNPKFKLPYYYIMRRPDTLPSDLRKYLKIQTLDEKNDYLIKEMSSVDAVVIHVRRGDFVTIGVAADMDFYKESLGKLAAIPDYHNKKFYVFSDDIPWCETHTDEIGFDTYFPDADITYVDHNRQDDDYKDMLVMSFAKVMIGSNSGFVRMAAWMSKTCEVFMCYNQDTMKEFKKNGRKNKYNVGEYSKNYNTAWKGGSTGSVMEKKKKFRKN